MMPHVHDIARRRDYFWRDLTRTTILILAWIFTGASALVVIWRIYG